MTNWELLLEKSVGRATIQKFATGELSMRQATKVFTNTEYAGEFRSLVRQGGTDRARNLARKALRRRGLLD